MQPRTAFLKITKTNQLTNIIVQRDFRGSHKNLNRYDPLELQRKSMGEKISLNLLQDMVKLWVVKEGTTFAISHRELKYILTISTHSSMSSYYQQTL